MKALDTNVVVRYLVNDDRRQSQLARTLFETFSVENPGFICREVALELSWVLRRAYGFSRDQVAAVLVELATTIELNVEAADDVILAAVEYGRGGAEFSDRMIVAAAKRFENCSLYTFDKQMAQIEGNLLLS